jgi:hypothetical protein
LPWSRAVLLKRSVSMIKPKQPPCIALVMISNAPLVKCWCKQIRSWITTATLSGHPMSGYTTLPKSGVICKKHSFGQEEKYSYLLNSVFCSSLQQHSFDNWWWWLLQMCVQCLNNKQDLWKCFHSFSYKSRMLTRAIWLHFPPTFVSLFVVFFLMTLVDNW